MERNATIDFMKCIAVFLVVCLHGFNWQGIEYMQFILSIFPRWVIPFFFITAGYYFGKKIKQHNSKAYFNQYVTKLISLFVIWYLFYLVYDLFLQVIFSIYLGLDVKTELINYITSYVNINALYYGGGMTSIHLWFLTALIWSIVILYVAISLNKLRLLLVVSIILNVIGLFGQTYSSIVYLPIETRDALFFGLLFTTIGCYFAMNYDWIIGKISRIKSTTFILLFLLFFFLQNVERIITASGPSSIGGYYATTAPLTISLFLLTLKHTAVGKNSFIAKIGKNAVGIYVSHAFLISTGVHFLNFLGLGYLRNSLLFNLVFVLTIFVSSYYFFLLFNSLLYRNKILISLLFGNRKQLKGDNKTAI